jgi:hypothetical protein
MSKIGVHLGAEKSSWVNYAKSKGHTPSGLAALIIKQVLLSEKIGKPIFQAEQKKEWGATERVEMRFNKTELAALDALVEFEGTTRQGFLIGLFRAHIANEPQYSTDEVLALRQSNTALRKIGTNLNMIAKSFNQGEFNFLELSEEIGQLQKIIEHHTTQVSATLNPSLMRYKIRRVG